MFNKIFPFLNTKKKSNEEIDDDNIEIDEIEIDDDDIEDDIDENNYLDLSFWQKFTIINEKVYMDASPEDIEHIMIEPQYVEVLYNQNPDEILYHLKQLSKSVIRIEVERFKHENNHFMQISIYPKYGEQQISLPSYYQLSKDPEGYFSINSKFYNDFFDFLEEKTEHYVLLEPKDLLLFNINNGRIITLSNEPNSTLYIVLDYYSRKLFLAELNNFTNKKSISMYDTMYKLSPPELCRRLASVKQIHTGLNRKSN